MPVTIRSSNCPLGRSVWSRTIRCILAVAMLGGGAAAAAGLGEAALAGNRPGGPAFNARATAARAGLGRPMAA